MPSLTPHLILDLNLTGLSSSPATLVTIGATTYFSADDGALGRELWKTDGTAAGTALVKDINPGSNGSDPSNLTNVNGTLFFTASVPGIGNELWKSDGTEAGTTLVKDINPGGGSSMSQDFSGNNLTNVNGILFFTASDGTQHGRELWRSDGTEAGTTLVKDIWPGIGSSVPYGVGTSYNGANLTNVNGILFFAANDGTHGY